MSLIKLTYSEFDGEPQHWSISDTTFININLIVGKNSSGKSRLLSIINSFAQLLSGQRKVSSSPCKFNANIILNDKIFSYELIIGKEGVISEILTIDSVRKLERNEDGSGKIFYEKEQKFLDFKLPKDALATVNRRDEIQHPFLIELNKWANSVVIYLFGSDFGKSEILGITEANDFFNNPSRPIFHDPRNLVKVYSSSFSKYGEDFDKAILSDMKKLGYSLSEVGAENLQEHMSFPIQAFGMFVVEDKVNCKIFQMNISQGMFRALALVIHLNLCSFSKTKQLIIIDDIGEGLDYERAVAIIELLIEKSKDNNFQIIMTSNDRFVMNKVPLEYWSVLKRKGSIVNMYNSRNSEEKFSEFKYLGLNNFDFFASDFLDAKGSNE